MIYNQQLVQDTVRMINDLKQKALQDNIVFETVLFMKKYPIEIAKIHKQLQTITSKKANWDYYLYKNFSDKVVTETDLLNVLNSIKYRNITFIFPISGVPVNKTIELSDNVQIMKISEFDLPKNLDQNYMNFLEHYRNESASVISITVLSEPNNDSYSYCDAVSLATMIISFLNFCLKDINSSFIFNRYEFLSPFENNKFTDYIIKSPFVIENKVVRVNKLKFVPSYIGQIPYFGNSEFKFSEEVDIQLFKTLYELYAVKEKGSKAQTLFGIIKILSDSIIETDKDSQFLKLISAFDSLLTREGDRRPKTVQIAFNTLFILDQDDTEKTQMSQIVNDISLGYSLRSEIIHDGKSISYLSIPKVNDKDLYARLFQIIKRVILSLLKDPRFETIKTYHGLFNLIDEQIFFEKRMFAYVILLNMRELDGSISIKKLKKKVRKSIKEISTESWVVKYVMFKREYSDNYFGKVINDVINLLIATHILTCDSESKRLQLNGENIAINNQDWWQFLHDSK